MQEKRQGGGQNQTHKKSGNVKNNVSVSFSKPMVIWRVWKKASAKTAYLFCDAFLYGTSWPKRA
jgi:hypothetical protein